MLAPSKEISPNRAILCVQPCKKFDKCKIAGTKSDCADDMEASWHCTKYPKI